MGRRTWWLALSAVLVYTVCATAINWARYNNLLIPHGDSAIYDALVRLVQPWSMRYPLAAGQGNFGSPGNDGAAATQTFTITGLFKGFKN